MGDPDRLSAAMLGLAAGALLATAGTLSAQTAVPPQEQERPEQATPPHPPRDTSARTLTDHDRACERGDGLSCQEGSKISGENRRWRRQRPRAPAAVHGSGRRVSSGRSIARAAKRL